MDGFSKITLFSALKKRMAWVNQRQEVLAQNIANADTPDYRAKDLKAFSFKDSVREEQNRIRLATTGPQHLAGNQRRGGVYKEHDVRKPYETMPGGNSVVLEEQMAKVGETQINHRLTSELYKKHLAMIRMAVSARR